MKSNPTAAAAAAVRLRALPGCAGIGIMGREYSVGADGCIELAAELVAAALGAGFELADAAPATPAAAPPAAAATD